MEKKYLALLAAVAVIGAVAFVPANVAGEIEIEDEPTIEIPLQLKFDLLGIFGIAVGLGTIVVTILGEEALFGIGVEGLEIGVDYLPVFYLQGIPMIGPLIMSLLQMIPMIGPQVVDILQEIPIVSLAINAIMDMLLTTIEIEELSLYVVEWGLKRTVAIPGISTGILFTLIGIIPTIGPLLCLPTSLVGWWENLEFGAMTGLPLEEMYLYFGVAPAMLSGPILLILDVLAIIPSIGMVFSILGFVIGLISMLIDIAFYTSFSIDAEGLAFYFNPVLAFIFGIIEVDIIPAIDIDIEW